MLFINPIIAQKKAVVLVGEECFMMKNDKIKLPKKIKSVNALQPHLVRFVNEFRTQGYLTFSIDSVIEHKHAINIYMYSGTQYEHDAILIPDEEKRFIKQANADNYIKNGKLSINQFPHLSKKVLSYFENNGFPFTDIYLDSINLNSQQVNATLRIDRHQFIILDSIVVRGEAKLSQSFLYPYLGLRRKKAYNEKVIKQIPARMAELPFVSEILPSGVEFVDDKAFLYLFLNKVKANQFDGYIGLVPVNEETGKLSITGELNLHLRNVFSLGESVGIHWNAPARYSQHLNIYANFPYLFWTPFGVDASFLLDKTDTSYLNMNYIVGLQYSFLGNNYIKTYFDFTSSNVLNPELLVVSDNAYSLIDYKKQMYGIEVMIRRLDYLYNPRKGFALLLNGAGGKMSVVKNSKVDAELYDDIALSTVRYRVQGDVKGYIPVLKRWVIVLGARGGALFGKQNVGNEMFKFGGLRTLQGFDEKALEATSYLTGSGEIRFLFSKRSYINAFFNGGWYERNIPKQYISDTPYGFGLGVAFDTKAGMFNLSYALGKQFDNPITFKTGKIHFGMVLAF